MKISPKPQNFSKKLKNGIKVHKNADTNKIGKIKLKTGTAIRLTKKDRKLKLAKKSAPKGSMPKVAEMETAKLDATNFGRSFLNTFVRIGASIKIDITQKKLIKKPMSSAESGDTSRIIPPASPREFSPS